ncbi:MAG: family N-acetyltransferase, partial [Paenibacillus sp.]|nr:family N-acetyltransferase [Paenibacillus sp.]
MVQIYDLKEKPELLESAAQMFWGQWGSEHNYRFYYDCMLHSISTESELPRFYIAMQHQSIIGMYAL